MLITRITHVRIMRNKKNSICNKETPTNINILLFTFGAARKENY